MKIEPESNPAGIDPGALDLLRCPVTSRRLRPAQVDGHPMLVVQGEPEGPRYPVLNGIPVLLPSAAQCGASAGSSSSPST
ncbi:MAG: hypothetical protein KF699_08045 [Phycisphaeraceae bacterium]|nr:hypothetical protein [Phycisphaeraceae bacterium]